MWLIENMIHVLAILALEIRNGSHMKKDWFNLNKYYLCILANQHIFKWIFYMWQHLWPSQLHVLIYNNEIEIYGIMCICTVNMHGML